MGRLAQSWHLFKTSLDVIRQDKELLWMPVLSMLASIVTVLAISGIGFVGGAWPEATNAEGDPKPLSMLLAFTGYVLLAFIGLFFNAAVVAGASERLAGGDPTVRSALTKAWSKAGRLFLWSLVVATVNLILQVIREMARRAGRGADIVGQITTSLLGAAWNLATFFIIPVMLLEERSIGGSLKRSATLFKQRWGETLAGFVGVGLIGSVVSIGILLVGLLLLYITAPLGMWVMLPVLAVVVMALVFSALLFWVVGGVYRAALYRYATTGQETGGFTHQDLAGAAAPPTPRPGW